MKTLLWLDDIRNPLQDDWLIFSPIEQPYEVIWVKTYREFVDYIENNGLPTAVCFDHDLFDFQKIKENGKLINVREYTGLDCANYLVEYCLTHKKQLPLYNIHSANNIGKENIKKLLENYVNNL